MNIRGAGQNSTVINATGLGRIFTINSGYTVTISDLTMTGGKAPDGSTGNPGTDGGNGGAVINSGTLILNNVTISNSKAGNGGNGNNGAGISTNGKNGGNGGNGGAIYNTGTLTINDSNLLNNAAGNGGNGGNGRYASNTYWGFGGTGGTGGNGGAIYSEALISNNYDITTTINRSILANNAAGNGGNGGNGITGGSSGSGGEGGAIYSKGNLISLIPYVARWSNLNVQRSHIINNNRGNKGQSSAIIDLGSNGSTGGIFNYYYGTATVQYNYIFNNQGYAIRKHGTDEVQAQYNWWGSNSNPNSRVQGEVDVSPWLILTITPLGPIDVNYKTNLTITAQIVYLNNGNPASGTVADGIPITFSTTWGNVNPITTTTLNGNATTTYTANGTTPLPITNLPVYAFTGNQNVNQTVTAYVRIPPAVDIAIEKYALTEDGSTTTHTWNYGTQYRYRIWASNNGPDSATGVNVVDILPEGLVFDHADTHGLGTYTYDPLTRTVTWIIGNLAVDGGHAFDIFVNVTGSNMTIINNATGNSTQYDWNMTNNVGIWNVNVPAAADVKVEKDFRNLPWGSVINTAYYNDKVYAIVKVHNSGPDLTSISVLDLFTGYNWTGTYYVLSHAGSVLNEETAWTPNDTVNIFNGTHWNIPTIYTGIGGNEMWLAIEGIINQTGINSVNNYAETVSQSSYAYNGYHNYTAYLTGIPAPTSLLVTNVTGNKGKNVNLTATLTDNHGNPLNGKIITFKVNGVSVPGTATTGADGVASLNYYIALVGGNYTIDAYFDGDANYTASTANGTLKVPQSSIFVTITPSKNNPTVGETITLTFKLGNNGPDTAENVVFTWVIPEGMEFVGFVGNSDPAYSFDPVTRTITWNLGNVTVGDPWLYVNVKILKAGSFLIKPVVTTDTYDPTLTNNVQSITINAVQAVNAASKTVGMQNTGMPIVVLVLAVLLVGLGFVRPKK